MFRSLIQLDQSLTGMINGLNGWNPSFDMFGLIASEYLIIAIGVVCVIWAVLRKEFRSFAAILIAGGLSQLTKIAVASFYFRSRPTVSHLFNQLPYDASFPSGHTAGAFALAFTVLLMTKWKSSFGWGIFILGFFIAFGRIFAGQHYVSDTIGGIFFGWLSAWIAVKGVGKFKLQNQSFKSQAKGRSASG